MATVYDAPEIKLSSTRLVGLELELDVGRTPWNGSTDAPSGWSRKTDGSLSNGFEYVLEPPRPFDLVGGHIQAFCQKFTAVNLMKSGGFHVHVQAHDYTMEDAKNLVRLYAKFQSSSIGKLVGRSRNNNRFCRNFGRRVDWSDLCNSFKLNRSAQNRWEAKDTRQFYAINLAMLRCRNAVERSLEFRQGSPSKRYPCVFGWTAFVVALTEWAKAPNIERVISGPSTFGKFVDQLHDFEVDRGWDGLAKWVVWRKNYLHESDIEPYLDKLHTVFGQKAHGIFHVSRVLDINLPTAQRLINAWASQEKISVAATHEKKYQICGPFLDQLELERLKQAAEKRAAEKSNTVS